MRELTEWQKKCQKPKTRIIKFKLDEKRHNQLSHFMLKSFGIDLEEMFPDKFEEMRKANIV